MQGNALAYTISVEVEENGLSGVLEMLQGFSGAIDSAMQKAEVFAGKLDRLTERIAEYANAVNKAGNHQERGGLFSGMLDGLDDKALSKQAAGKAGKPIAQGVAAGILENAGLVEDAFTWLSGRMITGGMDMMQAFANGIGNMRETVMSALNAILDAMIAKVAAAVEEMNAMLASVGGGGGSSAGNGGSGASNTTNTTVNQTITIEGSQTSTLKAIARAGRKAAQQMAAAV